MAVACGRVRRGCRAGRGAPGVAASEGGGIALPRRRDPRICQRSSLHEGHRGARPVPAEAAADLRGLSEAEGRAAAVRAGPGSAAAEAGAGRPAELRQAGVSTVGARHRPAADGVIRARPGFRSGAGDRDRSRRQGRRLHRRGPEDPTGQRPIRAGARPSATQAAGGALAGAVKKTGVDAGRARCWAAPDGVGRAGRGVRASASAGQ